VNKALRVIEFTVISYLVALLVDSLFYKYGFSAELSETSIVILGVVWSFTRMWSVTVVVFTCLLVHRVSVKEWFKRALGFSKKTLLYYFISPLIVYLALGIYVLIAYPLGLFDFNVYVEIVAKQLEKAIPVQVNNLESLARVVAFTQLFQAYIAAVTVNAVFALGEEIGWRGYLYELLGGRPSLGSTAIVGVCWGLWHASAILILGYNYTYNRLLGVVLFTVLTTTLTYPHLLLTSRAKSVLPASSLHGGLNALWPLTLVATKLPVDQRELLLGLGALGIIAWSITSTIIVAVHKATLQLN